MKTTGYCIVEPDGRTLKIHTIRYWRKDCIADFMKKCNPEEWKDWTKYGWRCKKVQVELVTSKKKSNGSKRSKNKKS